MLGIKQRPLVKQKKTRVFDRKRDTKKSKLVEKGVFSDPPTEDLGDPIEDESEAIVYREPTTYDHLLASLGSSNKVVADMNKRRQREEEGKSNTEGDEDEEEEEDSESEDQISTDGEDDEIQGADEESLGGLTENTEQENNDNHSEEEDSEDYETDEELELSTNGQASVDASSSTSAFSEHLSRKLSSHEVETLREGNWKFKWESLQLNSNPEVVMERGVNWKLFTEAKMLV